MFYNYLKLNFILELQKKYNSNFSMFTDKIFVLPPIFKKININYYLCFPVTKMLDEFSLTHPLKISRPIGVVLVSKNGKETIYNMSEYDFTSLSRDFNIPYLYNIERQEEIKSCLDMLSFSFPKLSREQKKAKLNGTTLKLLIPIIFSHDESTVRNRPNLEKLLIYILTSDVPGQFKESLLQLCDSFGYSEAKRKVQEDAKKYENAIKKIGS